ncbi:MAG: heavy-metal-associated domain-containing protein [Longimicrobiales bacterium]|nr:heavy-metal-associated domain-containing protein [Longimicrobiales bacterium]
MNETNMRVADMSCGHCVATVQGALEKVDGVESVQVSLDTKIARISHRGEIDTAALMGAVQAVGFTPELDR